MKIRLETGFGCGILLLSLALTIPSFTPTPAALRDQSDQIDLSAVDELDIPDAAPLAPGIPESPTVEPDTVAPVSTESADGENVASQTDSPTSVDDTTRDPPSGSEERPSADGNRFFKLIKAGGWIGAVIFFLSLGACAAAIRLFWILRRPLLFPETFIGEFGAAIEKGRIAAAAELCRRHPSFLATILSGGLRNIDGGWPDVEKGMEETLGAETARFHRKADVLMVVGNIAPMLGLLGTVIGMVAAFGELAASDGLGRFANLAQGIYFALVTTVDGLLAAIPALTLYAFFSHRIAGFSADAAEVAERLMIPVKRYFHSTRPNTAAVPPTARPTPHIIPTPSTAPIPSVGTPIPPAPPAISIMDRRPPSAGPRPEREERRFSERAERDDVS